MPGLRSATPTACAIAGALWLQSPVAANEVLRFAGTGAVNEMVRTIGAAFTAETGITIRIIPSLGTGGSLKALADGLIDLSIAGRPLTAEEAAKGLTVAAKLRTPFGLATSHLDPGSLKSSEIAPLYESERPVWADGTPIRIILRPSTESDTWLLGQLFPGMASALAKLRGRPDLSVAATDQDNADMAENTAGSLVGATLAQVQAERRNLRFIPIDGVALTLDNYKNGAYPFGKTLYVVLGAKKSAAAERFVAFLRSPKGRAALLEAGVLKDNE